MSEMHLRLPGFTYRACRSFTKNKERIQKFKEKGDSRYIYQNELEKICFEHEMAYGDFKNLTRRTAFDKMLHEKPFSIAKNPKCDWYQWTLASMIYWLFDKKTSVRAIKNENILNKELAEELYKPTIRNFSKKKYTQLLISKFKEGFRFYIMCN